MEDTVDLGDELGERAAGTPGLRAGHVIIDDHVDSALGGGTALLTGADAVGECGDDAAVAEEHTTGVLGGAALTAGQTVRGALDFHSQGTVAVGGGGSESGLRHGMWRDVETKKRGEGTPPSSKQTLQIRSDPRGGGGAPRGAPASFHVAEAEEGDNAEAGEEEDAGGVAARVLFRQAEELAEDETADAAAAADEAGHDADVFGEALRE
jgi:hypothetical protein